MSPHRALPIALAAALFALAETTPGTAQTFSPQGPTPIFGAARNVQSIDAPPNGTSVGAIQSLVIDPGNPANMYVGGVNGGVWSSTDGGSSWRPLGDNQRSLSIASLGVDPANFHSVVAGTGITSSSSIGGPQIGVLVSTNGGASWSVANSGLPNSSIVGVAVRGNTILAAASDPFGQTPTVGGLFRSVNGGTFQRATFGANGAVAVTSLAAGTTPTTFYAAVLSNDAAQNGVWTSTDSGQNWSLMQALAVGTTARLATGPNNSVAAAVYTCSTCAGNTTMQSVMLSQNGNPFVTLTVPLPNTTSPDTSLTFPGNYANRLLPVAIDPTNPNVLYIASSDLNVNDTFSVAAVRIVVTDATTGAATVQPLTLDGTANGSSPHADAREFAFDSSGRLYLTTDGGIYVRTSRQDNSGTWTGLNGANLQLAEPYGVTFDAVSKRMVVASQDIGVAYQKERNGKLYTALSGGDGHNAAAVNDRTRANESAIYTTSQNLGSFTRWTVDAQGVILDSHVFPTYSTSPGVLNFRPDDFTSSCGGGTNNCVPNPSKIELNKTNPSMIAFGTNYVYTTTDTNAESRTQVLNAVGTPFATIAPGGSNEITALAYGTADAPNALLAGLEPTLGTGGKGLWFSSTGTAGSLLPTAYGGEKPLSVLFDPRTHSRFYAVDRTSLWSTTDTGASFTNTLSTNLAGLNVIMPSSLEFIRGNGVNALLVGGVNAVGGGQSPVAVADSDAAGSLSNWRLFGSNLPNTIVYQMAYNPTVDVLAMSMLGRGAWMLSDVTTYFPTATVLRFGLADNDSAPSDTVLTNGVYAARALEKTGSGKLTISGTTGYTGSTDVRQGTLVANGNLTSSSGIVVGPSGTLAGNGLLPTTVVNGTVARAVPGGRAISDDDYRLLGQHQSARHLSPHPQSPEQLPERRSLCRRTRDRHAPRIPGSPARHDYAPDQAQPHHGQRCRHASPAGPNGDISVLAPAPRSVQRRHDRAHQYRVQSHVQELCRDAGRANVEADRRYGLGSYDLEIPPPTVRKSACASRSRSRSSPKAEIDLPLRLSSLGCDGSVTGPPRSTVAVKR